ncbi:MAG: MerR family transcriptional regulator [Blastomonas sp.]
MAEPANGRSDKSPDALRTIGEASTELGVKPHILRYWEAQFSMLSPLKRAGGRRYYRPEDMALLRQIDRLLNREGYTVKGARQYLRAHKGGADGGAVASTVAAPAPPPVAQSDGIPADAAMLRELANIRDRLAAALARA